MELTDKNVIVTGAAGGIGAALARRFRAEGAAGITVVDIDGSRVRAVADELGALAIEADVGDRAAVDGLVERAEAEIGPTDLFCANAGIAVSGGVEVGVDEWQRIWDINLMSHVHAARAVIPPMAERGGGYLLNTASAAGLLTQLGSAPYAVTKAAAVSLAEWMAITYATDGIRVSVLCPQAVRTDMIAGMDEGGVAGVDGIIEPDEVAAVVVEALAEERFLVLPHPAVEEYARRKGDDRERWLDGMRRLQARFPGGGFADV